MSNTLTLLETIAVFGDFPSFFADFPMKSLKEVVITELCTYNKDDIKKFAPNAVLKIVDKKSMDKWFEYRIK